VPFYLRAGKRLGATATEVFVTLKRPPQQVFSGGDPPNYLRFRLGPDRVSIALGASAKRPGPEMAGREVELFVCNASTAELGAYERLIGAALHADTSLFAREDGVLEEWHREPRSAAHIDRGRGAAADNVAPRDSGGPDASDAAASNPAIPRPWPAAPRACRGLSAAVAARSRDASSGGRRCLVRAARRSRAAVAASTSCGHERFRPGPRDRAVQLHALSVRHALAASVSLMPVDASSRARQRVRALARLAGTPPVRRAAVGPCADGHTASFSARSIRNAQSASPSPAGWRGADPARVERALHPWIVAGWRLDRALGGLIAGDPAIVGSSVRRSGATVLADRAAGER
jgi:hypothetical protein